MNPWARRHADQLERDLEDGETLLAANRVVLVSASSIASWDRPLPASPSGRGSSAPLGTRRMAPHSMKLSTARKLEFPLPGWIFVLGVSDRRVLFWRASALLAAPRSLEASLPFAEVAAIRGLRRVGATRLSIVVNSGAMLIVQALWSRRLSDVGAAFDAAR